MGVLHGFTFSAGFIDYTLNFNLAAKPILILPIGLGIGALYFIVFLTIIKKLDLPTPGREEEDNDDEFSENISLNTTYENVYKKYIEYLGGKENIVKVDNCATRLRLDVKDVDLIDDKKLKSIGARGVVKLNKTSVQVIVGTNVEFVADGMKELMKIKA